MFGRATITLGIGPHSSLKLSSYRGVVVVLPTELREHRTAITERY